MADPGHYPGRLIAIDGTRGKDTDAAAAAAIAAIKAAGIDCAISRWDASGLFGELAAAAQGDRRISTRSLSLVYAADLAFRLRWEIRPVLEAGGVVIAAPYTETAIAFAAACGVGDQWMRRLLQFAPPAALRARAEEKKLNRGWKRRTDRGYAEFCAALLESAAPKLASKNARQDAIAALDHPRGRKVYRLNAKGLDGMVKALIDTRRAAARRSAPPPHSGRK